MLLLAVDCANAMMFASCLINHAPDCCAVASVLPHSSARVGFSLKQKMFLGSRSVDIALVYLLFTTFSVASGSSPVLVDASTPMSSVVARTNDGIVYCGSKICGCCVGFKGNGGRGVC